MKKKRFIFLRKLFQEPKSSVFPEEKRAESNFQEM